LFLAPVTISASVMQARTTALLVGLASGWVTALLFFHQPLPWSGPAPVLPSIYMMGIWAALLIALVFIPSYVWRVSREGRRMSAALAASQRIIEREQRLSALDGLAAAAAHKLGTPLGTIALVSRELLNNPALDSGLHDDVTLMVEQANRCRDILASLTAEDTKDPVISRLPLGALLEEAVLEVGPSDKKLHVSCMPYKSGAGPVPEVLRQPELIYGIGNLIANAADFAAKNVWVSGRYSSEEVVIEIADDGPGFQPDILARLGEPYNTTRARGGDEADDEGQTGMGLGYFIARTLLLRSGGRIEARNLAPDEIVGNSPPDGAIPGGATPGGAYVAIHWPRARFDATSD
jgi:two-component system sensor histidine kinase RegB